MSNHNDTVQIKESSDRSFTEKYINIIGLVVLLAGIVLWAWGYILQEEKGTHSDLGKVMEMVGEFFSLVVSLHFFYELFTKKAERKILQEELNNIVNPQKIILDSLKQNVLDLDEHTKTVFNLVRYKDLEFFQAKWRFIANKYNRLYIVGDFNFHFLELIKDILQESRKILSIYICAEDKNFNQISKILKFSEECVAEVSVYHIDRLDWGFIAFGINNEETNADLLLNYFASSERSMSGYHIIGDTAINLLKSLAPNIEDLNELSGENKTWPLKITDHDLLRMLIDKRLTYNDEINNLRNGYQLSGERDICLKMTSLLNGTLKCLKVTHIAKGENINLIEHPDFQSWLKENYHAAAKGIVIDRILLLPRAELNNPIIKRVTNDLHKNKIRIRFIILEDVERRLIEDFSIYDDKHLVYIFNSGKGAWVKDGSESEARYSMDKDLVSKYNSIFNALSIRAKEFTHES